MGISYLVGLASVLLIDLFGAYDPSETFTIKGYFKAYDLVIVLACLPVAWDWWKNRKKDNRLFSSLAIKMVLAFFALLVVSSVATYIAGGVTITSVIQMARNYLPYALIFPVIRASTDRKSSKFFQRLIFTIASVANVMIILVAIAGVDWFSAWPKVNVVYQGDYIENVQRLYFSAFTFPVLAFILKFWEFSYSRKGLSGILVGFFALGFLLQGFRSYIVATFISMVLLFLIGRFGHGGKIKAVLWWTLRTIVATSLLVIVLWFASPGIVEGIGNRIETAVTDFVTQSGSFEFRLLDNAFRWQVFSEHPVFGVGMVHVDTERGSALGLEWEGPYSLGTTDSGYLDILTRFGVIGLIFFLVFAVTIVKRCALISRRTTGNIRCLALSGATFVCVLALTQVSHSGFTSTYGILPLVLILGILESEVLIQGDRSTSLTRAH